MTTCAIAVPYFFGRTNAAPMDRTLRIVMPGLDPGIHLSSHEFSCTMDCRVKPGNDESVFSAQSNAYPFTEPVIPDT